MIGLLDERQPVARIDLLTGDEGAPLLIELELVEPRLFLRAAPHAAPRFAEAVARRIVV